MRRCQKANFSYYFLKIHTLIQRTTKNIQAEQAKIQISILKILEFQKRKCVFNKLHLQENYYASLLLINGSVKDCTGWWSKRTAIFRTCFCAKQRRPSSCLTLSKLCSASSFPVQQFFSLAPENLFKSFSLVIYGMKFTK